MFTVYDPTTASNTIKDVLVKENVYPAISNLFPTELSFLNSLGTLDGSGHVMMEVPIDTMDLVSRNFSTAFAAGSLSSATLTTLARPSGWTPSDNAPFYQGRLKSVMEIQMLSQTVSKTAQMVNRHGITDAKLFQAVRLLEALAQNIEFSAMWSPGTGPGGSDLNTDGSGHQTVRQTQGLAFWTLPTGLNRSKGTLGASPGSGTTDNSFTDGHGNNYGDDPTAGGIPALNQGAMTWAYDADGVRLSREMLFENVLSKWYQLCNSPQEFSALVSPGIKSLIGQFSASGGITINQRNIDANSRMLNDGIDVYRTDWGSINIRQTRHLSQATTVSVTHNGAAATTNVAVNECAFFYNPQGFRRLVGRPPMLVDHGVGGDWNRFHAVYEGGVCCLNPQHATAVINCLPI